MSATVYDTFGLPLDKHSPWPKFRANAMQNGRMPLSPSPNGEKPWTVKTGKGIFSSPVVDDAGNVYIGSADHVFYAIDRKGTVKWTIPTGEIIDSSALLDDKGRVYFPSGDQNVYCADRETGELIWKSAAHSLAEVEEIFGIETYNVTWFEGNMGILPDGSIIAPNDNYIVYRMDRGTGERTGFFPANEMIWSLPAVNPESKRLFFGTCFMLNENVFCYNYETGEKLWTSGSLGTVSASPLLTNAGDTPVVVIGSFDGYVRALSQEDGGLVWETGLRDHIYASPARLSNGDIIQACTDGSLYCLDPATGEAKWTFDTPEPIRSSPAIDGHDQIYFGNGEGKLFCVSADGTLRWWYRCILEPRCDMNSSPALGRDGVYIAGESGEIFFVPYDYPLRPENAENPRCKAGPKGDLPEDGVFLLYTGPFGGVKTEAPEEIENNAPIVFSLFVRERGKTVLSCLDKNSFTVESDGGVPLEYHIAANGRFVCVFPKETWTHKGGEVTLTLKGSYTVGLEREGLRFFGGKKGGEICVSHSFRVLPAKPLPFPFKSPVTDGGVSTVLELCRQAVPLPAMMPSLNQIGFDSLHYLAGMVERRGSNALMWVVSGKYLEGENEVVFDPSAGTRYPLLMRCEDNLITLYNYDGFKINFVGSWDMPHNKYRIAAALDEKGGFAGDAAYCVVSNCDEIEFYGPGMKLMGMSDYDTGLATFCGGVRLKRHSELTGDFAEGLGEVVIEPVERGVRALVKNSAMAADAHVYSLLLTDESGHPLPLYYTRNTSVSASADGSLSEVLLRFDENENVRGEITVRLMADTYPVLSKTLVF